MALQRSALAQRLVLLVLVLARVWLVLVGEAVSLLVHRLFLLVSELLAHRSPRPVSLGLAPCCRAPAAQLGAIIAADQQLRFGVVEVGARPVVVGVHVQPMAVVQRIVRRRRRRRGRIVGLVVVALVVGVMVVVLMVVLVVVVDAVVGHRVRCGRIGAMPDQRGRRRRDGKAMRASGQRRHGQLRHQRPVVVVRTRVLVRVLAVVIVVVGARRRRGLMEALLLLLLLDRVGGVGVRVGV